MAFLINYSSEYLSKPFTIMKIYENICCWKHVSRVSLRVYAQLPGDEIQDGYVIEFADAESVWPRLTQDIRCIDLF